MELNEYAGRCVAKDDYPTQTSLILDSGLVSTFRNLRGRSELEIIERGVHIFWNATSNKLIAGDYVMEGRGTAVDLRTKAIRNNFNYIGDCHTHPYRRKMGIGVHIGPSTGDYMEWWNYPPAHFKIALHFVVSSSAIFLLITRFNTARIGISTRGADIDAAFAGVTADTSALNAIKERSMDDEKFNAEYVKVMEKNDYKGRSPCTRNISLGSVADLRKRISV